MFFTAIIIIARWLLFQIPCTSSWPEQKAIFSSPNNAYDFVEGSFRSPAGVTSCSLNGDIYISDFIDGRIHRLSRYLDEVRPIVGSGNFDYLDGTLLSSSFSSPVAIDLSPDCTKIAVADYGVCTVKIVDLKIGYVTTIAGKSGYCNYAEGSGSSVRFRYPLGIAIDKSMPDKVLYVADTNNCIIRKIDILTSAVTLFAGKPNVCSFNGVLEGDATTVTLRRPRGLYYDANMKSLFISDTENCAIRKVNQSGYLETIARDTGTLVGLFGLTILPENNTDYTILAVLQIRNTGNEFGGIYDGNRVDAQLSGPYDIHLVTVGDFNASSSDEAKIIISDSTNGAIRSISIKSGYLSTLAVPKGTNYIDGEPKFSRFRGVDSFDLEENRERNLYLAESGNNVIRRIKLDSDLKSLHVETFAGKGYGGNTDGDVGSSLFSSPYDIHIFNESLIFLTQDDKNDDIRLINLSKSPSDKEYISTFTSSIPSPWHIISHVETGRLFISTGLGGIKQLELETMIVSQLISSSSCTAPLYVFGLAYDKTTNMLYFSDYYCYTINAFNFTLGKVTVIAGSKTPGFADGIGQSARFNGARGVTVHENFLYISDTGNSAIRKIDLSTNQVTTISGGSDLCGYRNGLISVSTFCRISNVRISRSGAIFVGDRFNNAIRMIKDNRVTTIAGYGSPFFNNGNASEITTLKYPQNVIITTSENAGLDVYVVDSTLNAIILFRCDSQWQLIDRKVVSGDGSFGWTDGFGHKAVLNEPSDIVLDKGIMYVCDSGNNVLRKIEISSGNTTTLPFKSGTSLFESEFAVINSPLNKPRGISFDPSTEAVYIADTGNHCIRKYIKGIISTVSGKIGSSGYINGNNVQARFSAPESLIYDPSNQMLYISDTANHVIRSFNTKTGLVDTLAGPPQYTEDGFQDGPAQNATFSYPGKVTISRYKAESSNIGLSIYVVDEGNRAIRSITCHIDNHRNCSVNTIFADVRIPIRGIGENAATGDLVICRGMSINSLSLFDNSRKTSPSSQETGPKSIVVVAIISITSFIVITSLLVILKFRHQSNVAKIIDIAGKKGARNIFKSRTNDHSGNLTNETSLTLHSSTTVPIAIPGFLELSDKTSFRLEKAETQEISTGGTSKVLQALLCDPALIEKHGFINVAIKVFDSKITQDAFLYEVMIMTSLPKITQIVEFVGYIKSSYFAIVMKSYPNNLKTLLVDKAFLSNWPNNCKILTDIAKGMKAIHDAGVVHFDLKPGNILFDVKDNEFIYVICDFGFANFSVDIKSRIVKGVKRPSAIGLTVRYAAPELIDAAYLSELFEPRKYSTELDKGVDVYAFAMISYEVFTRRKPWGDTPLREIETRVLDKQRPLIDTANFPSDTLSIVGLETLIKDCWSHFPRDRPSFRHILERIDSFIIETK